MIAKNDIDPDDFYFASTLNAEAITALPEEVNGKNRPDSEKKLKSKLIDPEEVNWSRWFLFCEYSKCGGYHGVAWRSQWEKPSRFGKEVKV